MKRIKYVILGTLCILFSMHLTVSNRDIALTYMEHDQEQKELFESYLEQLPTEDEIKDLMQAEIPKETLSSDVSENMCESQEMSQVIIPDLGIDFESLRKENEDIVGWIYIPGTQTNYPILIGKSDNEYLYKNYKKQYQKLGSIYAHYRTSPALDDAYTVIFGHNMKSGRMFGDLSFYEKQSFRDEYPYVYIYTPTKWMQCTVYSCNTADKNDKIIYRYEYQYDSEEYKSLIDYSVKHSDITCDVIPTEIDQVFCLSTCTDGSNKDKRFVVHCVVTNCEYK